MGHFHSSSYNQIGYQLRTVENCSNWCAFCDYALNLHPCPPEQNPVTWSA